MGPCGLHVFIKLFLVLLYCGSLKSRQLAPNTNPIWGNGDSQRDNVFGTDEAGFGIRVDQGTFDDDSFSNKELYDMGFTEYKVQEKKSNSKPLQRALEKAWKPLTAVTNKNNKHEVNWSENANKLEVQNYDDLVRQLQDEAVARSDIESDYTLIMTVGQDHLVNDSSQMKLRSAVATVLNIPVDKVRVSEITEGPDKQFGVYVRSKIENKVNPDIVLNREDILNAVEKSSKEINKLQHRAKKTNESRKLERSVSSLNYASVTEEESVWTQTYTPYLMGAMTIAAFGIIVLLMWWCIKKKRNTNDSDVGETLSNTSHIPQQICLYPPAKPNLHTTTLIQPTVSQIYTHKSCGECGTPMDTPLGTPVNTPPMKIKAKRLLERRGSNASLTLDLGQGTEKPETNGAKPVWGSPPRESSTEEYLLSAGNRMSRKQLRSCLREIQTLYEEFWEIPMNHPDRVEVPGSGTKNRYRTILPNEHSRVKLPEISGDILTTYINANYIRGYGGETHAYIATQGPMSHTVIDFWRMVWHEKIPIIVMITKLKEKNKIKCECYLPEEECDFGGFHVKVTSISEKEGFTVRHITITYLEETHNLHHYWYSTWPDHKAPSTAKTLLDLVREVDKQRYDGETGKVAGPVAIHCSAGIGRTGCFIATSIGMQQLRDEHMIDVLGIICSMRLDRGGMVQTNEQYVFVHQALSLYEKELPDRPPSGE